MWIACYKKMCVRIGVVLFLTPQESQQENKKEKKSDS